MRLQLTGNHPAKDLSNSRASIWLASLLLFMGALLVRLINLDHLPHIDELYTVLGARAWLAADDPTAVAYPRAELYTLLVVGFFQAFGESLVVARLPSVITGSLLVVAVFLWTRSVAGALPAWIAALFAALCPLGILISQYARFYAPHALLFWLAVVGIYQLAERRFALGIGAAVGIGAGLCLLLAAHLQQTTLIGAAGVGLWLVLTVGLPWLLAQRADRRRRWTVIAVLVLLSVAAIGILVQSGVAGYLLERYRWTPLHAAARRNEVWFYHFALIERYPTLWPIFPFTALLAVAAHPRPTLFCLVVFTVSFTLLSFGGMKHLRYLFFVFPFLFVIWAIALAESFRLLRQWLVTATDLALRRSVPLVPRRPARAALMATGLVFLLLSNGAPARTILKPFGLSLGTDETSIDWAPARVALEPWLDTAAVVLTPNDVHALYYLGRYDIAVSGNLLSEIGGAEFSHDPRTRRPVISTPTSLELIFACYADGLIVSDETMYRIPWAINNTLANLIEAQTVPVDAPPDLRAFRWERPLERTGKRPAECWELPGFRAKEHPHTG